MDTANKEGEACDATNVIDSTLDQEKTVEVKIRKYLRTKVNYMI